MFWLEKKSQYTKAWGPLQTMIWRRILLYLCSLSARCLGADNNYMAHENEPTATNTTLTIIQVGALLLVLQNGPRWVHVICGLRLDFAPLWVSTLVLFSRDALKNGRTLIPSKLKKVPLLQFCTTCENMELPQKCAVSLEKHLAKKMIWLFL